MLGWFKKRPTLPLASAEEREALLRDLHPLFRVVDAGFHTYMEVVAANPTWDDNRIEQELRTRGVEAELAQEVVSFAPLAFGREVVQQLSVKCSDLYRLHNLTDGSERELPLANETAYAWARAMIGLYRTAERNEAFMLVAGRSAELDAVNNALHGGVTEEGLRECTLGPSLVHFRRAAQG
jgi:hypothetical protein